MSRTKEHKIEEALSIALQENALQEGFRDTIRRLVFDANDQWRICCGNLCEPCVMPMGRAVDRVRELIGWGGRAS